MYGEWEITAAHPWGLGLGVRCLVFGVWCLVFGVWCLVFGDWCLVCGVWGLGFGIWGCPVEKDLHVEVDKEVFRNMRVESLGFNGVLGNHHWTFLEPSRQPDTHTSFSI